MTLIRFLRDNARWLCAGGLLTFLSSFGQTFFIAVYAGDIRAEFGLSHGAWGGIYSLATAVSAALMVSAGGLTDRFRSRGLGAVGLVCLALACLGMAIVSSAWLLPAAILGLRFFGQGMMGLIAMVSMSRWFVAARGRALSVAGLGVTAGQAILPVIFVALLPVLDWRWHWVLAAGLALCGVPLLLWLLREERTPQSHTETSETAGMDGRHWRRAEVLRHPLFWAIAPGLLGPPAFGTALFFQQVHFVEVKGWRLIDFVAFMPVFTVVTVAAMMGSGAAIDRFGTARILPVYLLPAALAFVAFGTGGAIWTAGVGLGLMALTQGMQATLPNALWAEFFGTRHLGAIKSMGTAIMVLGTAIGPGLTGALIDLGVGIEAQYLGVAVYFLAATAAILAGLALVRRRSGLPRVGAAG
ncbi:Major Facilitator Superfamily protein [Roseivivax jejudonensis]|uniref:Major Facilitator Superfamily protein n=1 Tax=Roseivivax jejudonensis TaxID=1529041 RepID=A0A1X6ZNC9_9RHOB|nr:MFS transporter [Roseivivax jejudonensis]SLN56509.1 Major Facilitator Superfamily protein [Roseivivax jejudonensis]